AMIADTITRYKEGKPVLYYTWTPYWVSDVMVPGRDVVWLQVPFSSLPGEQKNVDTKLPNGANYGFPVNT
ncbi:glycine betaine ABC transporter substrate-binding protein, partial [Escherichia coli]|uniref:glycine betaine ABC transporter substrate-binding protein n=2 Tax=Enterobacterales TaxID=91347 RepID=UPI0024DE7262